MCNASVHFTGSVLLHFVPAQRHLAVDLLRRCLRPYLCGPVLAEAARHVWGQISQSPPHPPNSPMPDWECGNVSSDIIPPAGPVRTGKAIQLVAGERSVLIRSSHQCTWDTKAMIFYSALLISVFRCNGGRSCLTKPEVKMPSRRWNLGCVSI